jgi:hypothetical protein
MGNAVETDFHSFETSLHHHNEKTILIEEVAEMEVVLNPMIFKRLRVEV